MHHDYFLLYNFKYLIALTDCRHHKNKNEPKICELKQLLDPRHRNLEKIQPNFGARTGFSKFILQLKDFMQFTKFGVYFALALCSRVKFFKYKDKLSSEKVELFIFIFFFLDIFF